MPLTGNDSEHFTVQDMFEIILPSTKHTLVKETGEGQKPECYLCARIINVCANVQNLCLQDHINGEYKERQWKRYASC